MLEGLEEEDQQNETAPNLRPGRGSSQIFEKFKDTIRRRLSSNIDLAEAPALQGSTSEEADTLRSSVNRSQSTLETITEACPTEAACVLVSGGESTEAGPKQGVIDWVEEDAIRFTFREYEQTRCLSVPHERIFGVKADKERQQLVLMTMSERLVFGGFQGGASGCGLEAAYYGLSQIINRSQVLIEQPPPIESGHAKPCGCGLVFREEEDYGILDITITVDPTKARSGGDIFRCPILANALLHAPEFALLDGSRFGLVLNHHGRGSKTSSNSSSGSGSSSLTGSISSNTRKERVVLLPEVFEDLEEVRQWRVVTEVKRMGVGQVHLGIVMKSHLRTFDYDLEYPIELCLSECPSSKPNERSIRVLSLVSTEGVPGRIRRLANERLLPVLSMMFYESVDALQVSIDGLYGRAEDDAEQACPIQSFSQQKLAYLQEYWVWRVRPVLDRVRGVTGWAWQFKEILLALCISFFLGRALYYMSQQRIERFRRQHFIPVDVRYKLWARSWTAKTKADLHDTAQHIQWMLERLDHRILKKGEDGSYIN
jgi:hypothetical protein